MYAMGVSRQDQFNLRVPEGTLYEWKMGAAERGLKLSVLIRDAVASYLGAAVALGPESSMPAVHTPEADSGAKDESAPKLAAGSDLPDPGPPTPRRQPSEVKVAKVTPVEIPRPKRRHDPMCSCLVCRG